MKRRSWVPRVVFALAVMLFVIVMQTNAETWKRVGVLGAQSVPQYFVHPSALCTDADGRVYVLDPESQKLSIFSSDGKFVTSWKSADLGRLGSADMGMGVSCSVSVGRNGDVYVSGEQSLFRFSKDGRLLSEIEVPQSDGKQTMLGGTAVGSDGSFYVVDAQNSHVYKFTSEGKRVSTFGEEGRTAPGQLTTPYGIAVDSHGDLLVSDNFLNKVQKFDPSGKYTGWHCGNEGPANEGHPVSGTLGQIGGLAVDKDGTVYVADYANGAIAKFDSNGKAVGTLPVTCPDHTPFPVVDVAYQGGASPGLWVVDMPHTTVMKLDPVSGKVLLRLGNTGDLPGQSVTPSRLAVDKQGNVYVADYQRSKVEKFSAAGKYIGTIAKPGRAKGEICAPVGLAIDPTGKYLYVAEQADSRMQKLTVDGSFDSILGSAGPHAGTPSGMAVDASGNVFVVIASTAGTGVQEFSPSGKPMTMFGTGTLNSPEACAVDKSGFLYVTSANFVYKFSISTGRLTGKLGGYPSATSAQDGTLHYPVDVKIGPNGHVYVLDEDVDGNKACRIQEFSPSGKLIRKILDSTTNDDVSGAGGMEFGRSGDLYISSVEHHCVYRFSSR